MALTSDIITLLADYAVMAPDDGLELDMGLSFSALCLSVVPKCIKIENALLSANNELIIAAYEYGLDQIELKLMKRADAVEEDLE